MRIFNSSRITEVIQESDNTNMLEGIDQTKTPNQANQTEFFITTPTKDFSTSCTNIDEPSMSRKRMAMMDKQKSFDQ